MTKRVALYVRVSTGAQSTDRQVRELRAFAAAREWEVVLEAEDVASGAASRRPGRDRVLQAVRRRQVDAVLVQALDRWARSVPDLVGSLQELEALGVAFVVPGLLDMTTPAGRAVAGFLGVVAEFERDLVRERVRSGLDAARARGRRLGRPPVKAERIAEGLALLEEGKSFAEAARQSGASVSSLLRARRRRRQEGGE